MIAFLILYLNLQQFFVSPPEFGSEEVQSKIDQFLGDANTKKKTENEKAYEPHRTYSNEDTGRKKTGILAPEYFPFNPNTAELVKEAYPQWKVSPRCYKKDYLYFLISPLLILSRNDRKSDLTSGASM